MKKYLLMLFVMSVAQTAHAFSWSDLWWSHDQLAARQLNAGQAELAMQNFKNPVWRAVAEYRAGDYSTAAQSFNQGNFSDAEYNYGNALAQQGKYAAAIQAYEHVLKKNPQHADAKFNRDLLKKLMQQKNESPSGSSSTQDQKQNSNSGSSKPNFTTLCSTAPYFLER